MTRPDLRPIVDQIRQELLQGERTANELAQLTGSNKIGVSSCLGGMRRRREVKRTIVKPGKPAVWRLL